MVGIDADGITVNVDTPVNGKTNLMMKPEELNGAAEEINGEAVGHSVDSTNDNDSPSQTLAQRITEYDKQNGTELGRFVDYLDNGKQLKEGESRHFRVGHTGELLNGLGIKGDIAISTTTVGNRHTKNAAHNLTSQDWYDVINDLNTPLAITKYGDGYRIYTHIKIDGNKSICVGVEVRKVGRGVEITNIKTAFGRDLSKILWNEDVVYPTDINELKQAIAEFSSSDNSRIYPPQPFSSANIANNSESGINNTENNSQSAELEGNKQETDSSQPTALERIPKDEQGNPIYEQTDAGTAWDAIVEQAEGDEVMAQAVANGMVADKQAALSKAEKAKSKGGKTVAEKIAAEKERAAAISKAKAELEHWQEIASTVNRRKAEAEEAQRKAAEELAARRRAEEERLKAEKEEAERIERKALNGVPDMVDDTPQAARTADSGGRTVLPKSERRGQGDIQDTTGRQQSSVEKEIDENGHPFVVSSDGTTTFGEIRPDSGLTPAPIKLSEGFNNVDEDGNNIGYGRAHIDAGHGKEIRDAGYPSIEAFVEDVAKHYGEIRIGRDRKSNSTYMLLEYHDDKHQRTLYVELSHDGTYWNVNSGGIFRNGYIEKKDIVWPEPTVGNSASTDATEVAGSPAEAAKGETADRGGNSSQPISTDKGSEKPANDQTKGEKVAKEEEKASDDKGNVISPSKRFNSRKADERYHKSNEVKEADKRERALRDALSNLLREAGIEVIDDVDAGQSVLDMANEGQVGMDQNQDAEGVIRYYTGKRRKKPDGRAMASEGRGYVSDEGGRLLSNRAKEAEEEGVFPMSKFISHYKVTKRSFSLLRRLYMISSEGWHHTGNNFKKTDYYGWSEETLSEAYTAHKKELGEIEDRLADTPIHEGDGVDSEAGKLLGRYCDLMDFHDDELRDFHIRQCLSTLYVERRYAEAVKKLGLDSDKIRLFRSDNGEAYGFTVGGKIYIDPRYATAETPIHEYTHLWADAVRSANPKEWGNIVELMKGTWAWEYVKNMYPELKTDDEIADEALAHFSGKRGAERLRSEQERVMQSDASIFDKAAAVSGIERVRRALKKFWSGVCDLLHVHFTTAEEVADRAMADMLRGVDPRKYGYDGRLRESSEGKEKQAIIEKAKADGTYMKAPNGKKSNLSPRQWVQVRTKTFKDWFGDWELPTKRVKVADATELHFANNGEFLKYADEKFKEDDARRPGKRVWKSYTNKDTGNSIKLSTTGISKSMSNKAVDKSDVDHATHLRALGKIDEILENSVLGEVHADKNGSADILEMQRYYGAVTIDGKTYRVKTTVKKVNLGKKGISNQQYSFEVQEMELLEERLARQEIGDTEGANNPTNSNNSISVAKLLENVENSKGEPILNSSKVVDENGEPLVVYHHTGNNFYTFDRAKARSTSDLDGFFFYPDNTTGEEYGRRSVAAFLNIKNPAGFGDYHIDLSQTYAGRHERERLQSEGYDGVINDFDDSTVPEYVAFDPNQIKSATDNVGTFSGSNPDIRYQFIGEQGAKKLDEAEERGERMDNLRVAREMEKADKDAKTIKLATGWERGADGKWRYEIADAEINHKEILFVLEHKKPDGSYPARSLGRVMTGPYAESLFRAYPYLRGVRVEIVPAAEMAGLEGKTGVDYFGQRYINLSDGGYHLHGTLLHEIQHAIQDKEGFARGGNVRMFWDKVLDADSLRARAKQWKKSNPYKAQAMEDLADQIDENGLNGHVKLEDDRVYDNAFAAYEALMGEVEARNVEKRMGMSAEERRQSLAAETEDVAREDQIFLRGEGGEASEMRSEDDDLEKVNERFNDDLERYDEGELPQGFRFDLGHPSAILRSAGFDDLPISMRASLLARKAGDEYHPFDTSDLKDLVKAIQKPIAIFRYSKDNMRNLIVDTEHNGKHFLVGITLNYKANGIEINSVSGLFPKESHEWIKWIQDGKAIRIDQKDKVQDLIASLRTNPAESERIGLNLDAVAKIVKDFENPAIEDEKYFPATPEEAEEGDVMYREVDDEEAARLDAEPTIKVYRAMQEHDGKLYPPMSGRIKTQVMTKKGTMRTKWVWREPTELGKWEQSEEHPETANDDGTFTLDKGNGESVPAAYNPYIHTSRTPINDQFASAWNRPELVTVEVEVPASELTSGYHAEKAKDSVGETPWKSGPVGREMAAQGNPRMVILSRWDKPIRIVPVDEVADEFAVRLAGTGIKVPFNTVPPALREALVAKGIEISEPEKGTAGEASRPSYDEWMDGKTREREGKGSYSDDEISYENDPVSKAVGKNRFTQKQRKEFAERERQRMAEHVESLAKKLHLDNVEIVTDSSQLEGKKQRAKGFYSKSTGKITIVIPNHNSLYDVEQTLLHEAVAHYGLRQLFGDHFDTFLDNVFNNAEEEIRERIVALASKNGWSFRTATEEYLAGLAENTEFENTSVGWWRRIKDFFLDMLHKIGFENFSGVTLSDNELRYILWRSYENLKEPGKYRSILGEAEDVAKQYGLKVGNYAQEERAEEGVAEQDFHSIVDEMYTNPDFNRSEHLRDRYDLGKTPNWMKRIGITGDNFSLSFKNIKTHQGKDADHDLTREEWHSLPEAIQHPFLVTQYKGQSDRYRLYVNILHNGHYVAVGVDVKRINQGKGKPILEVNSIKTVFAKGTERIADDEVIKAYDEKITPEQEVLLRGHNFREYPSIQELSAAKVGNKSDTSANNSEKVSEPSGSVHSNSERRQKRNAINRTIDQAVAIVTGRSEKEARDMRHAHERERKEEFKEICEKVLSGDFNDVTLQLIDKYIDDATPKNPFGRRISQRLPQKMERGLHEGARANAVDALFTRICESDVRPNERFGRSGRGKIERKKKKLLEGWAKATGRWYTGVESLTNGGEPIGKGKDFIAYLSKDGNSVIKFSHGKNTGRFLPDIDAVNLFNYIFPNSAYTILGYGNIGGHFVKILEQPFVDFANSTPLNAAERAAYMEDLGFKSVNDDNTVFNTMILYFR